MSPEEEFKNSIKPVISRGKEMKFYATFVGAILVVLNYHPSEFWDA